MDCKQRNSDIYDMITCWHWSEMFSCKKCMSIGKLLQYAMSRVPIEEVSIENYNIF